MLLFLLFALLVTAGQASGSCLKPNISWVSQDHLDTLHPVPDPYQCQAICGDTEGCAAFTWTTAENQEEELLCFLFSSVANQTSFDECVSGPDSCTCSSEVACHGDENNIAVINNSSSLPSLLMLPLLSSMFSYQKMKTSCWKIVCVTNHSSHLPVCLLQCIAGPAEPWYGRDHTGCREHCGPAGIPGPGDFLHRLDHCSHHQCSGHLAP